MASSPSDDALYGSEKDDTPLTPMSEDTGPEEIEGETPEEREKRLAAMKEELEKVESEITMLRQVLGSKVRHATELKRQLGITPFQEFKHDLQSGLNHIKSSDSIRAITRQSWYQKTSSAMKTATDKTSSLMSSVGQSFTKKMGDLKNSQTFKSLDERVHTTYNTVKAKVTGSRSSQDIDEAFREAQVAEDGEDVSPGVASTTDPVEEKVPL